MSVIYSELALWKCKDLKDQQGQICSHLRSDYSTRRRIQVSFNQATLGTSSSISRGSSGLQRELYKPAWDPGCLLRQLVWTKVHADMAPPPLAGPQAELKPAQLGLDVLQPLRWLVENRIGLLAPSPQPRHQPTRGDVVPQHPLRATERDVPPVLPSYGFVM